LGVEVGEVAAATAGDEDLLAGAFGVVEEDDASAALSGFESAHHSGAAPAPRMSDVYLLKYSVPSLRIRLGSSLPFRLCDG
jgi:hypothetical protein